MAGIAPPRNVIYFSSKANQIPLAGIANLPYTDVIVAFLVPDSHLNLVGAGGAFDDNLQTNIRALQNAGKNVLISFGGAIFASAAYRSYAQNVNGLVNQIVNFVTSYGFNGVDIDFEDNAGFMGDYDGIGFLSNLTSGLYQALLPSARNIITHAPQTPYWDQNFLSAPYARIWQRVGNQIAWINNQFYDNPDYDRDAATKVLWYRRVAAITGAQKLLVGALVANTGTDEGYITLHDMIQNVITPLKSTFGSQFGGVMGWEFALDQGGAWAKGIGQALFAGSPGGCPGRSYTVVRGDDTLSGIAQRFLGDGALWVELTKPDGTHFTEAEAENLQIGQVVCIPGPGGCPGRSYTVVAGDTLVAIAQRFLGDGARWVELTKPDGTHFTEAEAGNLQIGQLVCIPGQALVAGSPGGCPGRSYTVVAGDTLVAIAQSFLGDGTRWVELTKPDGTRFTEAEAENLQIGQLVCIPDGCPGQSYTVVAGDTLVAIAQRFLGDGARWVELTKPDGTRFTQAEAENLQIGQLVCIPGRPTGSKVLNFLRSISGSRTVAGQHNREPNSEPAKWTNAIHDTTGRFPGLWSGDFLFEQDNINNRQTMVDEAKNQWKQGALINLMYHACPPTQGEACGFDGGVLSHLSDGQWNELITDGSNLNRIWKARLDVISVFLQDLKDNGVEVLWRPLHEMNQGKFWWGGRPGPQGTARLYQITHDYMVRTKGLTNLIWVWDVQDLDFNWAPYNPGGGYWDVLAMDMYGDGYTPQKYQTLLQLAGDKPIAIGECQRLPTADELAAQPRWTFFMAWAELVFSGNSVQQIQALYNAANVITLDQLPGWG